MWNIAVGKAKQIAGKRSNRSRIDGMEEQKHGTLLKLGFNTTGTRLFPYSRNGTNVPWNEQRGQVLLCRFVGGQVQRKNTRSMMVSLRGAALPFTRIWHCKFLFIVPFARAMPRPFSTFYWFGTGKKTNCCLMVRYSTQRWTDYPNHKKNGVEASQTWRNRDSPTEGLKQADPRPDLTTDGIHIVFRRALFLVVNLSSD
jgi:hypothetical protein